MLIVSTEAWLELEGEPRERIAPTLGPPAWGLGGGGLRAGKGTRGAVKLSLSTSVSPSENGLDIVMRGGVMFNDGIDDSSSGLVDSNRGENPDASKVFEGRGGIEGFEGMSLGYVVFATVRVVFILIAVSSNLFLKEAMFGRVSPCSSISLRDGGRGLPSRGVSLGVEPAVEEGGKGIGLK